MFLFSLLIRRRIEEVSNDDDNKVCGKAYTIKQGENLISLKNKYSITELYSLNPNKNLQILNAGDTILVPTECEDKEPESKIFYVGDKYDIGTTLLLCTAFMLGCTKASEIRSLRIEMIQRNVMSNYNGYYSMLSGYQIFMKEKLKESKIEAKYIIDYYYADSKKEIPIYYIGSYLNKEWRTIYNPLNYDANLMESSDSMPLYD